MEPQNPAESAIAHNATRVGLRIVGEKGRTLNAKRSDDPGHPIISRPVDTIAGVLDGDRQVRCRCGVRPGAVDGHSIASRPDWKRLHNGEANQVRRWPRRGPAAVANERSGRKAIKKRKHERRRDILRRFGHAIGEQRDGKETFDFHLRIVHKLTVCIFKDL